MIPSRATILTGQYSHAPGFPKFFGSFDPKHKTGAERFRGAGYQTPNIGKWHLKRNPANFGFQDSAVLPGQGGYKNPVMRSSDAGSWPNNKKTYVHSSDVIGHLSLDWLQQRNKDKPFLYEPSLHMPFLVQYPPEISAETHSYTV